MPSADGAAGYPVEAGIDPNGRRWPEIGTSRIPNWIYTDPEIFAREQHRIFEGQGWLYTCLDVEIPKPGDFKRIQLGAKECVVVRGPAHRDCCAVFRGLQG